MIKFGRNCDIEMDGHRIKVTTRADDGWTSDVDWINADELWSLSQRAAGLAIAAGVSAPAIGAALLSGNPSEPRP